mgnify:CR=1 FL=1
MGLIQKMPLHLANMIAAGEVVQRPSSVVKELVENSIDAKSKSITIYLENGGIDLIKVVDDGCGMDKDDVVMAFLPHATSKIKTEYDLFRINTLGFRGEAIASIASVSSMQIISSVDGLYGYSCSYKAGVKQSEGVINSNKGTTVIVKNLFFNTPARLKYLKSAKSELAAIMFYIDKLAISNPDIRIKVLSDNNVIFQTTASNNIENLILEIYGIQAAKNVLQHEYVCDGYMAKLVLIKPSIYRSNKLEITMVCNKRYVKNYNITNAVVEAFHTYLPVGKYPIAILYFTIDPLLIDVNVHPTKTEIKISDEEAMCQKLIENIRLCLQQANHIVDRQIVKPKNQVYEKTSIFDIKPNLSFNDVSNNYALKEDEKELEEEKTDEPNKILPQIDVASDDKAIDNKVLDDDKLSIKPKIPYMEYVGTVFATYLIFQNSEGMYMIDQHAAMERINYEKYYDLLASNSNKSSPLLVPIMLQFTKEESLFLEQNIFKLQEIGFVLDQAGQTEFFVREIPLWAKLDNLEDILYDILSMMISKKKIDVMYFRDNIAKQISCKASIKANDTINKDEINALLEGLNNCKNPYTCPHGRPTIIKLSISDIEKMFERIMK